MEYRRKGVRGAITEKMSVHKGMREAKTRRTGNRFERSGKFYILADRQRNQGHSTLYVTDRKDRSLITTINTLRRVARKRSR